MQKFIKKLIDRLEERKNHFGNLVVVGVDDLGLNYNLGKMHSFEDAIEIVNELAEEYINCSTDASTDTSTYFCEWKAKGNYYITQCSNETDVIWSMKDNYKYCPYCGKKIKVAPYTEGE